MQASVKDAISKRLGGTTPEHYLHSLISSLQIVDDALYEVEHSGNDDLYSKEHDAVEQLIQEFRTILEA
jgi:hypothetical protein